MLKNYVTETGLQGFVYEKDLYLWTGQTDLSASKERAEQVVINDFINRGYKPLALRPDLYLRTSTSTLSSDTTGTSYEDIASRLRLAYNVTVRSGTTSIVLQGSNDEVTWTTIQTQSITATGEGSFVFLAAFKYYRINAVITAGTLAFTAWLTEASYDLFFAYKWLEIILMNAGKAAESKYTEYGKYFLEQYEKLWNGIVWEDADGDGTINEDSKSNTGVVTFGR